MPCIQVSMIRTFPNRIRSAFFRTHLLFFPPRKYFCYTCCVPLEETKRLIPEVKTLPVKVDIIKHAGEVDGKVHMS